MLLMSCWAIRVLIVTVGSSGSSGEGNGGKNGGEKRVENGVRVVNK